MIDVPGVNEFIDLSDAPHSYAGQTGKVVKVNAGETAVEFGTGGGGGSTTFIGLTDVPASYAGSNGKVVAVNAGATALEFISVGGTGTVTSVGSSDSSITVTSPTTTPNLVVASSPKLTTPRAINGVNFDGTAAITVADSTKQPLATVLTNTTASYTTTIDTRLVNTSGTNTGDQTLAGLGGVASNTAITGATNTKITYDAKGLVTAGSAATTADIAASTNKNYVTDAQAIVIGNTSGTNSGDNAINTLYSGLVSNATHTGDATGATALTLATVNANIGAFTNASITVNAKGLVTAAASGTAPVTNVTATSPITSSGGTTPVISTSMNTGKLIGRNTAGVGVMEEITLGTNLSMTGTTLNATGGGGIVPTGTGFTHITAGAQDPAAKLVAIADMSATGTPSATTYLRGDNTWATPAGGGGSTVSGQATVNFGAITQEDSYATVTVNTTSALTASIITVTPSGVTTADHDPDDYQWDNISGYVSNIINGVSFDIIGVAPNGTWGNYKMNYLIN